METARTVRSQRATLQPHDTSAIATFLQTTELLDCCPPEVVKQISRLAKVVDVPVGMTIVDEGSLRQGLGFILAGSASVRVIDGASKQIDEVLELKVGDSFGEVGVLVGGPQPHRVVASSASRIVVLGPDAIEELGRRVPAFSAALSRSLARKLVIVGKRLARGTSELSEGTLPDGPAPSAATAGKHIQFVRVSAYSMTPNVLELVPRHVILRDRLLPLELTDNVLTIGLVEPDDVSVLHNLNRVLSSVTAKIVAISADDFTVAVSRLRLHVDSQSGKGDKIPANALVFEEVEIDRDAGKSLQLGDQVVKLASEIVAACMDRHASDIHIETTRQGTRVRFRVNGVLKDWDHPVPSHLSKALIARFKVLAGVDITERRRPQDGRIGARVGSRDIDLRLSTLPATEGEKLVMRVFEAAQMVRPLDEVFVEPRTLEAVKEALNRSHGAIVVAGPTGAGKSSTLYAALHERRRMREDLNIVTVEDPVEYRLKLITQVQVNHQIGLGFAPVLRGMLRQDPDVIMVGEVRDSETAQLALEASMTGHLLLTSIHANNAPAVIQRFENLGCSRSAIAQSLSLILVQRLVRRLCPACARPEQPPEILIDSLSKGGLYDPAAPGTIARAAGCTACDNTGLSGRVAVIESLRFGDEQRAMLMAGRPLSEISSEASKTGALTHFSEYARYLLQQSAIGAAEALVTVTS